MVPHRIETPREFFDHVVTPDVDALKSQPTDLRSAYHACTSLLSLRDWIWHKYGNKTWSHAGAAQPPFTGTNSFQSALERIDTKFAIVTDVANASKHMVLDKNRKPRTNLWGNANTELQTLHGGALGSGPLGAAPLGGTASRIIVKIDQTQYDVLDCVTAVHTVWSELMSENSW